MPLKIELKPHERIIIGEALIVNDKDRTSFYIDGSIPILREKYILREVDANTPCKRVYFAVQQMYLSHGTDVNVQNLYITLVHDVLSAAPSLIPYIAVVTDNIINNNYYAAIKSAGVLLEKEVDLFGEALNLS